MDRHMAVVAEASNGRKAIQQYRAHRPDIALMDSQMPGNELSDMRVPWLTPDRSQAREQQR